jgi:MoCo/4Fe-4S cofactor protein with predicted Tat translocation signal
MDKPLLETTAGGRRFWRSLEERLESADFRDMVHREYPDQAATWLDPVTRRRFLTLLGASLGLAGLTGCGMKAPREKIVPYVRQPEGLIPGRPQYYATAMTLAGTAVGLLVESHEGRPTKIEGNPNHPASLGATDVFSQASVLGLYDPDRSQTPISRVEDRSGQVNSWEDAEDVLRRRFRELKEQRGKGLRILTEAVGSPALAAQLAKLLADLPEAQWIEYEPARLDPDVKAAELVFGQPLQVRYDFSKADFILALDADFLSCGGGQLKYVRDFTARRRVGDGAAPMNRLYAVEASPGSTGMIADHRLTLQAAQVETFARLLAIQLGLGADVPATHPLSEAVDSWIEAVLKDLDGHRGRSLVVAGNGQPPAVHALAYAINDKLGNVGKTVFFAAVPESKARRGLVALQNLADDLDRGEVEMLLILGGNPAYATPADLHFGDRIGKAKLSVHLGLYQDETAEKTTWHINEAHYLETWGDGVAFEGTASIAQPLIAPLYAGRSAVELVSALTDESPRTGHQIVQEYWAGRRKQTTYDSDFQHFWRKALNDGVILGTKVEPVKAAVQAGWAARAKLEALNASASEEKDVYEIVFRLDPTVFDGRFANNGWLQELPKPLSKLTWDNAALVGPKTAAALGIKPREGPRGGAHGEIITQKVEISFADGRKITAPLWVVPGHAESSITLHFGYGRTRGGKAATATAPDQVGFNAYDLWTTQAPFFEGGAKVRRVLDSTYTLACTQAYHKMDAGGLLTSTLPKEFSAIRSYTLSEAGDLAEKFDKGEYDADRKWGLLPEDDSRPSRPGERRELPLIPLPEYAAHGWGMAIDLAGCVGCGACVVACQAENNSPVVGKEEVTHGREMHWLRIDRYYEGDDEHVGRAYFQPVPCMHCETAPCEQVCPVEATVHSPDGINEMTYNRCVGTRYCSNNCPYKVRRFNFLQYTDYVTPSLKLQRNPDVTVRSRGVMEKCTYCVQRIREAEIHSQNTGREMRDGDVLTACQAACPARAITFGSISDPNSRVTKLKKSALNYGMMADLNTRPRTTYLAAIRNPNPDLEHEGT